MFSRAEGMRLHRLIGLLRRPWLSPEVHLRAWVWTSDSTKPCVQSFFETHEADAAVLRHDRQLAAAPQRSRALHQLPSYLRASVSGGAAAPGGGGASGRKRRLRAHEDPLKVRHTGCHVV
jgi:hypothetical protein